MRKLGGDCAIKAIRPGACLNRPTPHLLNQERLEPQTVFLTEQLDLDWRAITATTAILALVVVLARAFLGVTVAVIILLVLDDRWRAPPTRARGPAQGEQQLDSNWPGPRTEFRSRVDPWMHLYGARSQEQR